jgi:hypothetical protein
LLGRHGGFYSSSLEKSQHKKLVFKASAGLGNGRFSSEAVFPAKAFAHNTKWFSISGRLL